MFSAFIMPARFDPISLYVYYAKRFYYSFLFRFIIDKVFQVRPAEMGRALLRCFVTFGSSILERKRDILRIESATYLEQVPHGSVQT